jgi:hypothetical protein
MVESRRGGRLLRGPSGRGGQVVCRLRQIAAGGGDVGVGFDDVDPQRLAARGHPPVCRRAGKDHVVALTGRQGAEYSFDILFRLRPIPTRRRRSRHRSRCATAARARPRQPTRSGRPRCPGRDVVPSPRSWSSTPRRTARAASSAVASKGGWRRGAWSGRSHGAASLLAEGM